MKKTLVALTAATALAAGTVGTTSQANAAWWVVPAIVAGAVGTVAVGVAAANANNYYYGPAGYYYAPRGSVYVQPYGGPTCQIVRQQAPNGRWYRVRVCG